jgi:hypothetical protein
MDDGYSLSQQVNFPVDAAAAAALDGHTRRGKARATSAGRPRAAPAPHPTAPQPPRSASCSFHPA